MSGKRPEGRSPEANILASPKYSKTLPSATSEPPRFAFRTEKPHGPPVRRSLYSRGRHTGEDASEKSGNRSRTERGRGSGPANARDYRTVPATAERQGRIPATPSGPSVRHDAHRKHPAGTLSGDALFTNTRNDFRSRPKRDRCIERGKRPDGTHASAQTSGRTETPQYRHVEPLREKGPPPHAQNGNKTGRRTAAPSYLHQNRNRRRRMAGRPQVLARPTSRKNDVPSAPPRQARSTQGTPSVPQEVPVRPIAGYSPAMKSFISRSRASRRCNRRNWAHERCRLWVGCRIL